MTLDVTDASFETDVLARSDIVPVVVDLWAPWCEPCKALSPIIERVVESTGGAVELAKVNIDENPAIAQSFQVQSIPAVFAIAKRQIADQFIGAIPEAAVREFVQRLLPAPSQAETLTAAGDEASLRSALELEPDLPEAIVALALILLERSEHQEALDLLVKIPDTGEAHRLRALARLGLAGKPDASHSGGDSSGSALQERLDFLLDHAKSDDAARQELIDLLETMDPLDTRRQQYRRALASRLF